MTDCQLISKVTMLADDWFKMYHEYEASEDMKGRARYDL